MDWTMRAPRWALACTVLSVALVLPRSAGATPCSELSISTCALPFPSDAFAVADGSTATGLRIDMPNSVLPAGAYGDLPTTTRPSTIFAGSDGYAATTPVMFELTEDVLPGAIPVDGGDVVAVFDTATGAQVPVVIDFDRSRLQPAGADNLIQAWPRTRFEYGHQYVALVYGSIPTQSGNSAALSTSLVAAWAAGWGGIVQQEVTAALNAGGLASGTVFSVRSAANAQSQLEDMVATARSQAHPISAINVQPNFGGIFGAHVDTVVFGHVRVTDFRSPIDGALEWYPGFQGYQTPVPFILTVPKTHAGPDGAPVVLYGHGLAFFKETAFAVSEANAKRGLATLSMEQPFHPPGGPEPYIFDILEPSEFERVRSLTFQSVVHHTSLLEALKTSFVGRDWQPWSLAADIFPQWFNHGNGVADLDADYVLYQGSSLGGVLGAGVVALNPDIDGAMLQVAGAGTMHTLMNSQFWNTFDGAAFSAVLPPEAEPQEAAAIIAMATHHVDRADASNFVERLPLQGQPLLSIYTHMDPVVYNRVSERLTEMTGGVLYGPQRYIVPHIPYSAGGRPADGNGAYQMYGLPDGINDLISLLNHIRFITDPGGLYELDGWLGDRLSDAGY